MKKLGLLLLLPLPLLAQEWTLLAANMPVRDPILVDIYTDESSLKIDPINPTQKRMTILYDYKAQVRLRNGPQFKSAILDIIFDCKSKTVGTIAGQGFSEQMAKGEQAYQKVFMAKDQAKTTEPASIFNGTAQLIKRYCMKE